MEPTATLDATVLHVTAVYQVTLDAPPEASPIPTQTLEPLSTWTSIPTIDRTRPPIQSPTPQTPCNIAAAGHPIDVTIPDGTVMAPGESFSKTWRLENTGSCTWTRQYAVTYFSGNSMNALQINNLAQPVEPGQVIDVTVDMQAPLEPGVYQSNWMLANVEGEQFGIGPNGDAPFWVKIEVVPSITETPMPTPTMTPTPVVYLSGEAKMADDDQLDLDSGGLNPEDPLTHDFIFQLGENPVFNLVTVNGAVWALVGDQEPSFEDCISAEMSIEDLGFDEIPEGTYVCYRTSQALPGRFLIVGLEEESLWIQFLTWSVP